MADETDAKTVMSESLGKLLKLALLNSYSRENYLEFNWVDQFVFLEIGQN